MIPCAARESPACSRRMPADDVASRDPMDGAAICASCADALDLPYP